MGAISLTSLRTMADDKIQKRFISHWHGLAYVLIRAKMRRAPP